MTTFSLNFLDVTPHYAHTMRDYPSSLYCVVVATFTVIKLSLHCMEVIRFSLPCMKVIKFFVNYLEVVTFAYPVQNSSYLAYSK
jgi:hypothetical protein